MKVALFSTSPAEIPFRFIQRHMAGLGEEGVSIPLVVIDENQAKRDGPLAHAIHVARRQSRIAGCSTIVGLTRILAWKLVVRLSASKSERAPPPPPSVEIVRVPTLNSTAVVSAVKAHDCDLIFLMGTRIVTRQTLRGLGVPVVNFHSSDPTFMRGAPAVVWEVLAGKQDIVLTIHHVVRKLDAGKIYAQTRQPILFAGGLGRTSRATMNAAVLQATDLFRSVALEFKDGTLEGQSFEPAPVHVTPSISQTLRADLRCRKQSRGRSG
jgi:hypothetical protein